MKLLLTSTVQFFAPKFNDVFGDDLASMNVLCIPTAAYAEDGYERWLIPELDAIRPLVKTFTEFDIKDKTPDDLVQALNGIDIVYVTGGNTYCLLEAMNQIGFKNILISFLNDDGVYLGSSAGSIVTGPDIGFVSAIDDPLQSTLTDYTAMSLVDFLIMPHMSQDNFHALGEQAIADYQGSHKIIPLHDDQAILVENGEMQIIGA